jgi:hypothetical protein
MTTEQLGIICISAIGLSAVVGLFVVWIAIVKAIVRIGGRKSGRISRFNPHESRTAAKNI